MSPLLAVAEAVQGPLWAQIVYAVITAIIAALLVPYLNNKRKESAAARAAIHISAARTEADAGSILMQDLKDFLLERAFCIAEKDLPEIARKVLLGDQNEKSVKVLLKGLGTDLKLEAITYFRQKRGLDLLAFVGDKQLDRLIEFVANRASPFPGKTSSVEFLKSNVSNWLVKKGVAAVRKKYLLENIEDDAPLAEPLDPGDAPVDPLADAADAPADVDI